MAVAVAPDSLLLLEADMSPCRKPLPAQRMPPDVIAGFVPRTLLAEQMSVTGSYKSMNTTECVPVRSLEQVMDILSRQGCKIQVLRGKMSTYIKTQGRGVFLMTGSKEDVEMVKSEVLSEAKLFSLIQAAFNKAGANCTCPRPDQPAGTDHQPCACPSAW
jgi:hypothetical protein